MTELFKTVQELQAFFEWAKANDAHKIKVGEIEVEFVPDLGLNTIKTTSSTPSAISEGGEEEPKEVDQAVLFHSSDP